MKKYKLYVLRHPETMEIRYVGVTKHSLERRLSSHICDKSKTYKTNWIKSLKNQGLKPVIELVTSYDTKEEVFKAEIQCIRLYRGCGKNLVNIGIGGEGGNISNRKDFKHSDETKEILRQKSLGNKNSLGYSPSEETRRKIGEASKNRIMSEETRKKISKANAGRTAWNKGVPGRNIRSIVDQNGKEYVSIKEASIQIGCCASGISKVLNGKKQSIKGFIFKYKELNNE